MIKKYCDICGKEITEDMSEGYYDMYDFCGECRKPIKKLIEEMKTKKHRLSKFGRTY